MDSHLDKFPINNSEMSKLYAKLNTSSKIKKIQWGMLVKLARRGIILCRSGNSQNKIRQKQEI